MFRYFKKIYEINFLSFFTINLLFLIPYLFYYIYTTKELYIFILFLFSLIFIFIFLIKTNEIKITAYKYFYILCFFIFTLLVSGFNNQQKNIILLQEKLWLWSSIIIFIYVFFSIHKINIKKIIDFLIFFNGLIILIGLIQYISFLNNFGLPFIGFNTFNFRVYSVFGNPDNLAIYIISVLPFLIYKFFLNKKNIYFILIILNISILFLTKSLSGIISFLIQVCLIGFFYLKDSSKNFNKKYFFAGLILIIFFLLIIIGYLLNKKSDSIKIRLFLWESTLSMIKDYPLLGVGSGNFRIFTPFYQSKLYNQKNFPSYIEVHDEAYTHNDFLQIFSEQGIIGFLAFLLLIFYPFYIYFKNQKKIIDNFIILSLIGIIIFSFFNFPFSFSYIIFIFILLSLIFLHENNDKIYKININLKYFIMIIIIIFILFNLKFISNFYERYYLIQYFSYKLAKGNISNLYNDIKKYQTIIKTDYQLSFYSGTILNSLKKFDEAENNFKNAIKLYPYFSSAYYNLGNTYNNIQKYEKAIEIYKYLLNFNPTYKPAYNNLATIYINLNDLENAISVLQKGLQFDQNSLPLNFNLALCYFLSNNIKQSTEILTKILQIDNNYKPAIDLLRKINEKL